MMSQHESVAVLLAIVLALASLLLLAEVTDNVHGSQQVQAEYAGFDALAKGLFGSQAPAPAKGK